MVCFEVIINNKKICTAGLNGEGVLTVIIDYIKQVARNREATTISVGGLAHRDNGDENLNWIKTSLSAGDEVTIKIVDSEEIDNPMRVERSDPDFSAKQERKYYAKLKKKYEG